MLNILISSCTCLVPLRQGSRSHNTHSYSRTQAHSHHPTSAPDEVGVRPGHLLWLEVLTTDTVHSLIKALILWPDCRWSELLHHRCVD